MVGTIRPINKHLRANTTLGQNSFWHQTIPDWNSLPAAAIESKTVVALVSGASRLIHGWQRSRVNWLTKSISPFPSSLILQIGGAAG